MSGAAVEIRGLDFAYAGGAPVLRGLSLAIAEGERCLLVGANGSGKTTLLNLIAGRHLIDGVRVRVLGRPAFADTTLAGDVAILGGVFPFDVDVGVSEILARRAGADAARRDRLLEVLGVEPAWRMSRISDGQRRRVQLLLGLLEPRRVLLLDEVTTDLDAIARADLLAFLREESERGATILYATHIFDGLESWATHLAFLDGGRIARHDPLSAFGELRAPGVTSPLLRLVETWLRSRQPARVSG
ncbi:MAG TPA: ATP-binding cassette domain-containing protein [Polyangia bacterium]|nr:ATP-binding cassette domain-containing protein [Polyangia bacterium]